MKWRKFSTAETFPNRPNQVPAASGNLHLDLVLVFYLELHGPDDGQQLLTLLLQRR